MRNKSTSMLDGIFKGFSFIFAVLFVSMLLLPLSSSLSQTRDAGAAVIDTSIGDPITQKNPENLISSDNVYATIKLNSGSSGKPYSNYFKATNYGFSLPSDATIEGIVLDVERKCDDSSAPSGCKDYSVRIVKNGVIGLSDRSTSTDYTSFDSFESHGNISDLWDMALTPSDVNSINFGAAFASQRTKADSPDAVEYFVDSMSITVYYNVPPVSDNQLISTNEDSPVEITLSANDADSDSISYNIVSQPVHGTLSGGAPNLIYTPDAEFSGDDSFTFNAYDSYGNGNTAVISITVNPVNDAPVALDDYSETDEDNLVAINSNALLANDLDIDSPSLSIVSVENPVSGTVSLSEDVVTFTPDDDFTGTASFEYTLSDGSLTSSGKVFVMVNPLNDAPVANDDYFEIDEDSSPIFNVLDNDYDLDEDSLSVSILSNPLHGTVVLNEDNTITYTPELNYFGEDSFSYSVFDGFEGDEASVSIIVNSVNDAPAAEDMELLVDEDSSIEFDVSAFDVDGDSLIYSFASLPENGIVSGDFPNLIYFPNADFNGEDSFIVNVSDGLSDIQFAVNITVNPVNDALIINSVEISASNPNTLSILEAAANASDIDGDNLIFTYAWYNGETLLENETSQFLDLSILGNGDKGDNITVVVKVSDGFTESESSASILILNRAPSALDANYTLDEDSSASFNLSASDSDSDSLTFVLLNGTLNGTLSFNETTGEVIYTPNANYFGEDSFTFLVNDAFENSSAAAINFTINDVSEPSSGGGSGGGGGGGSGGSRTLPPVTNVTAPAVSSSSSSELSEGSGASSGSPEEPKTPSGFAGITGAIIGTLGTAGSALALLFILAVIIALVNLYLKKKKLLWYK